MPQDDTSSLPSAVDPRTHEIMQRLAGMEPLIRRRIREIRGPRDALLSTSELYATLMKNLVVEVFNREESSPSADAEVGGAPKSSHTALLRYILEITRDSVTRTSLAVARWRNAESSSVLTAHRSYPDASSPLDRMEFNIAMQRLIDGLAHEDRELLYLRMKGRSWAAIAEASGMAETACRQRWVRMLTELRRQYPND